MDTINQTNLKTPDQVDWDTAFAGQKYSAPPPALGVDGKPITYMGKVASIKQSEGKGLDTGYLNYEVNLAVPGLDRPVRTWISTRTFQRKNRETGEFENVKGNPNALAQFLRSAGLQAKPATNADYAAAVGQVNGRAIPFTGDWEAMNRDTGEVIRGYRAFPDDPERPGQKKSILKAGDLYHELDNKGNIIGTKTVQSEVLFANFRIKYFQDPTPKVGAR